MALMACEILCLVVLITVLACTVNMGAESTKKEKFFIWLTITHFIVVLSDIFCRVSTIRYLHPNLFLALTIVGYCVGVVTVLFLFLLAFELLGEGKKISDSYTYFVYVLCTAAFLVPLLGINGDFAKVVNGQLVLGTMVDVYKAIYLIIFVYMFIIMIICMPKCPWRTNLMVVVSMLSAMTEIIVDRLGLESYSTCVVTVLIFLIFELIVIRSIRENLIRAAIHDELAHKDSLTGLNNRTTFIESMKQVEGDDEYGVIFADINGLKIANDHIGHAAGDVLIKKFADILRLIFPEESIYKISGDEFVVVWRSAPPEFADCVSKLKELITDNNDIAAFGALMGSGRNIRLTIRQAERKMYEDKEEFYKRSVHDRRDSSWT